MHKNGITEEEIIHRKWWKSSKI